MTQETPSRSSLAVAAVRLAAVWILAGAAAKLFLGTPKDLPEIVRKLTPFGLDLTFRLVIAVELAIVSLAFVKPRLAWPVVLALFAFFDFILVSQLAAGAESCGCFGATIKVSPKLMLAVDSALILFLLASRPWSRLARRGLPAPLLAAGLVASIAAPWLVIRTPDATDGAPTRYAIMDPTEWVGASIDQIPELNRWVPLEQIPTDGKIVLWRQGCDHCASHLRLLAADDDGTQSILLLQIRDDLDDGPAVNVLPQGPHVTTVQTPENQTIIVTTPVELRVSGGVVTAALDEKQAKAEYEKPGGG